MTTTLSANGGLEIPEEFRKSDGLRAGQTCEVERVGYGEYYLRVGTTAPAEAGKERLTDILRSCPVKDFFVPADRCETTDDLLPMRFA